MNFFQISYGPQINRRMRFVETVFPHIQEGDTYTLLSDRKSVRGEINFIDAKEYEQRLIEEHEVIKRMWTNRLRDCKVKFADRADIIRVHYASENPDTFYCDTDIKLFEPCEIDYKITGNGFYEISTAQAIKKIYEAAKVPCFGCRPPNGIDDGLFYNGQSTDFFKSWFKWILENEGLRRTHSFGWYFRFMAKSQQITGIRVARIRGFYRHYYGA